MTHERSQMLRQQNKLSFECLCLTLVVMVVSRGAIVTLISRRVDNGMIRCS